MEEEKRIFQRCPSTGSAPANIPQGTPGAAGSGMFLLSALSVLREEKLPHPPAWDVHQTLGSGQSITSSSSFHAGTPGTAPGWLNQWGKGFGIIPGRPGLGQGSAELSPALSNSHFAALSFSSFNSIPSPGIQQRCCPAPAVRDNISHLQEQNQESAPSPCEISLFFFFATRNGRSR